MIERLTERLRPYGLNLIGVARAGDWPGAEAHLPGARSVIVVASAGPALWDAFRAAAPHRSEHPLDDFVSRALLDAESALEGRFRRFEAAFNFEPRVDFRALGRIAGLGELGPFGLLIHPTHGPWFGLRGAWLIERELPITTGSAPCVGCAAPCVDGQPTSLGAATAAMRLRCPIGRASRYSDEQIAYHHDGVRPAWLG